MDGWTQLGLSVGEPTHDLFRWLSHGSQISYMAAQLSLNEGPKGTRWKLHGFYDLALEVTQCYLHCNLLAMAYGQAQIQAEKNFTPPLNGQVTLRGTRGMEILL